MSCCKFCIIRLDFFPSGIKEKILKKVINSSPFRNKKEEKTVFTFLSKKKKTEVKMFLKSVLSVAIAFNIGCFGFVMF